MRIEPGTVLLMKKVRRYCLKKVIAAGEGKSCTAMTEGVIWDVFGIVGEKTEGSHLKHINISAEVVDLLEENIHRYGFDTVNF